MSSLIKEGFLDKFLFFEIFSSSNLQKDKKKFIDCLKKIGKSPLRISSENPDKEVFFNERFSSELSSRKKYYREIRDENGVLPPNLQNDFTKLRDKPGVHFTQNLSNFEVELFSDLEDKLEVSQSDALHQLISMYSLEEKHTGRSTKDTKNKFLLMPVKIIDRGISSYINVFLTIYKQGYAYLHFTYNIKNLDSHSLNINMWDMAFEKVLFPEIMLSKKDSLRYIKKAKCTTFSQIMEVYKEYFFNLFGVKEIYTSSFSHLTLLDYTNRPKNFEKGVNEKFFENIFNLLFAPITEFTSRSQTYINESLNKNFYVFSNFSRVYANHNRIVTSYSERIEQPFKTITEDPLSYWSFYISSLGGVLISIEYLLLRKFSNEKYSLRKIHNEMSLKELLKLKMSESTDYSHEFSQYFYNYASVRSFNRFLEKACDDYLGSELVMEHRRRVEELITLNKEKNIYNFTAISALFAILLTLIFSLPTIKQFFELLNLNKDYLIFTYFVINGLYILFIASLYRDRFFLRIKQMFSKLFKQNISKKKIHKL